MCSSDLHPPRPPPASAPLASVRKRRAKSALGKLGDWEVEQGEEAGAAGGAGRGGGFNPHTSSIGESSLNPQFGRKDTPKCFQWRVRNLPYPESTYSVSVDGRQVVIRTANKKYYKRFGVPELDHLELPVEATAVSWEHRNNTLVISYRKPAPVVRAEAQEREEILKMGDEVRLF